MIAGEDFELLEPLMDLGSWAFGFPPWYLSYAKVADSITRKPYTLTFTPLVLALLVVAPGSAKYGSNWTTLTPKVGVVVGDRVKEGGMPRCPLTSTQSGYMIASQDFELLEFGLGSAESKFWNIDRIPGHATSEPENRMTFQRHSSNNLQRRKVLKKKLTKTDIGECSRLYVAKASALTICPEAFARLPNENEGTFRKDLTFYDPDFNRVPMAFLRRGNKYYLVGGWGKFVVSKNLTAKKNIEVDEYICNGGTGERCFMIGSVRLFGVLIG